MKPASSQSSPVLALVLVTALCGASSDAAGPPATPGLGLRGREGRGSRRSGARAPRASLLNHGPRERRRVALTFDADMTQAKLAELRASGAAAASDSYDRRVVRELERTRT